MSFECAQRARGRPSKNTESETGALARPRTERSTAWSRATPSLPDWTDLFPEILESWFGKRRA
jgi:hypothetical protein